MLASMTRRPSAATLGRHLTVATVGAVAMPNFLDITGHRFGRLVALERVDRPKNQWRWLCKCDCGGKRVVGRGDLTSGKTSSCGCLRVERQWHTHRMTKSGEYNSWRAMHERCRNQKSKHFKYYGGRGIIICDRWYLFENFLEDMGKRPIGYTLDRIDPHGNYEPPNCRWATRLLQSQNQRRWLSVKPE